MQTMRVELYLVARLDETQAVCNEVVEKFGGAAFAKADGAWKDADCDVIEDEILIVTVFCPDTCSTREWFDNTMQDYMSDADQESVLYVINGNQAIFLEN